MILQQLVNGLTLGAVYTLIALSFSLVMGILGILNIAIADLFMLAGFIGISALISGFSFPLALAAGVAGAVVVSILIKAIAYDPVRSSSVITPLLTTLGCSMILQNVVTNVWGSDPIQLPFEHLGERLRLGPISVGTLQLLVLGTSIAAVAALGALVQKTGTGRGLRAVAENRDVARLLGVSAERLTIIAFALSGALAGIAGVLIGMHYAVITAYVGVETGLKAIAVMVVGGVTRIWGALLAGPLIGVLEVMTVTYGGSQIRDFVVYGMMILILLLRPEGLLGGRGDEGHRV